jgi:ribosomal protein S27AE
VNPPAYTISADGKSITCGVCHHTSYVSDDVRALYCPRCSIFLDEKDQVERRREDIRSQLRSRLNGETLL